MINFPDRNPCPIAREEGLLVVEGKGKAKILAKPRKVRNFARD